MSKRQTIALWSTVLAINFLLLNAGLDGWFTGFAYGSFDSKLKNLFLVNYIEALVLPIVLILVAYLVSSRNESNRLAIDHIKNHLGTYLIALILASQVVSFVRTNSQVNKLSTDVQAVTTSIWGLRSAPRLIGYRTNIMARLGDIDYKLDDMSSDIQRVSSNVEDVQFEIQYLQR